MGPISKEEANIRLLHRHPDQELSNFNVIQAPGDHIQMQVLV